MHRDQAHTIAALLAVLSLAAGCSGATSLSNPSGTTAPATPAAWAPAGASASPPPTPTAPATASPTSPPPIPAAPTPAPSPSSSAAPAPVSGCGGGPAAEIPAASPVPPATYVVRAGDTLSGIAKHSAVTLHNLLAANPQIADPSLIRVGETLRIPVAYLPTLGGSGTMPTDIDDRGQIVGESGTSQGVAHAVLIDEGRIVDLGTLGGAWSGATAINDVGQIVGWSDTSGNWRPFLWEAGSMIGIEGTDAGGINDRGQIVTGQDFIWQDGAKTQLGSLGGNGTFAGAINDLGQVVGHSQVVAGCPQVEGCRSHAFLWQDGKMTDLGTLGGYVSEATAVNDRGQVVGTSLTVPGWSGEIPFHAFLWEDGVMTDLGTLGGFWSSAAAVNDRGQVVGSSLTRSGETHAFLWQDGVMTDLGTLRGKNGETSAFAINNLGQVLGNSNGHSFLWQDGVMTDLGPLGPSRGCG